MEKFIGNKMNILIDKRLSFKAKALWIYGNQVEDCTMQDLYLASKEGKNSIRKGLKELQLYGYLKVEKLSPGIDERCIKYNFIE
ncbi:hypothetical protein UFOVP1357_31 [uncultured Caudovirales phage]|uniref:Uncharacterized protein n=1 Tax=uncultured Caudovirales phage TaxID=2100421 RepID=A0A6J5MHF9_9CAUD|nr:hypothetical protein UFOVP18_41 [uncultured Caudovirales phage]CAB4127003.1 hypothetical protein UFOVP82_43 [uncultured Caudovirales phage]CAB4132561.1 hypothetical protein UFOVP258_34 [uncultured Caudovirales phage]CAB4146465.1 hypothetical protein UFOVP502_26 [uncultured Caudovirales phage]CAB4200147.1 hypothetical protein UFOVP1357_31 [uncultured Caudovirales phage]